MDIVNLVAGLRDAGTDDDGCEVESAKNGFPATVAHTVSAFANRPGGGLIVFGLDEGSDFSATGVYDVTACLQSVANVARQSVEPAVLVSTETVELEGVTLVLASIHEAPATTKPVRVRRSGRAYIRQFDGDYPMSEQEEQLFVSQRGQPGFDIDTVPDATVDDLSADLIVPFLRNQRAASSVLAGLPDEEVLLRAGVVKRSGEVTLAGLLALGIYPQQFIPNFAIQASVAPSSDESSVVRARDSHAFSGPIPVMLDDALRWIQRNTRSSITFSEDGHGRDRQEYPAVVVRELVANALIHRDLGPHARSNPVSLRVEGAQMVISNPGGLFGLTVESLGRTSSHCRNAHLMQILQHVRTPEGHRVVERLGSGIPTVLTALAAAGMTPPHFHDQGIRFTVRVPNHALMAPDDLRWLSESTRGFHLSDVQRHLLVGMRHGLSWSNSQVRHQYPMDSREAARALQQLVESGLARAVGDRGQRRYVLAEKDPRRQPQLDLLGATLDETGSDPGMITTHADTVLPALESRPRTVRELVDITKLSARQVRFALAQLRRAGRVEMLGSRGRQTHYGLVVPTAASHDPVPEVCGATSPPRVDIEE